MLRDIGERAPIRLVLPRGADPAQIPATVLDLFAIVVSALDESTSSHSPRAGARVSLRVPVQDSKFWARDDVRDALAAFLRVYKGRTVAFEPVSAAEASVSVELARTPKRTCVSPRVIVFSGALDALAALVDCARRTDDEPVAVAFANPSQASKFWAPVHQFFADVLDAPHISTASAWGATSSAPTHDERPIIEIVAAVAVALSLGRDEVFVCQNGVDAFVLPGALSCMAARRTRATEFIASAAMRQLLSLAGGRPISVHQPYSLDTPVDVARALLDACPTQRDALEGALEFVSADASQSQGPLQRRIDQCLALLGAADEVRADWSAIPAGIWGELLVPVNTDTLDAYVNALRELSKLTDDSLLDLIQQRSGRLVTLRSEQRGRLLELLRAQVASVRAVLAEALSYLAPRAIDIGLPEMCLLARAMLARNDPTRSSDAPSYVFRRRDEQWEIRFGQHTSFYSAYKGLAYIHALVSSPGRAMSATELRACDGGHPIIMSASEEQYADPRAITQYRARLRELEASIDDARARNDLGTIERKQREREQIEAQLRRSVNIRGQPRMDSEQERARKSVSAAIKRALERVEGSQPECAAHLRASIWCGNALWYNPDEDITWIT